MVKGDPRFHALLAEIADLHDKKQADYGAEGDPFRNLRSAEEFGLPVDLGIAIRMNDKMNRLKSFFAKGELENESVEDAYMDIAVYALAAIVLRREENWENIGVSPKVASTLEDRVMGLPVVYDESVPPGQPSSWRGSISG